MKTTVFTLAWNESYLLPYFLEHYHWATRICIFDNESTDDTRQVAMKDRRVTVHTYKSGGEQRNTIMRDIKNQCWKGDDSDWVIVVDIDEFFYPGTLLTQYEGKRIVFKSTAYQMVGQGESLPDINRGYRDVKYDKCCCFSPQIKEIAYKCGAHIATPKGHEAIIKAGVLRHYSFLSENYVVKRWQRYAARISNEDRHNTWGSQYLLPESTMRSQYCDALKRSKPL